ncbi:MAG: hypothetical protein WD851_16215 [Pirellulales bacterium]
MLRFQQPDRKRPRNYLARREQYRLFALIVGLGIVLLLMRQLSGTSESRTQNQEATSPSPSPAEAGGGPAVEQVVVDRVRLAAVRDNSDFRKDERDAWFYLLSLVPSMDGNQFVESVTYAQFVAQPHVYRGKLVRIGGAVKRIEAVEPGKNDVGITTLYRVILQPKGRSLWPIMVYCRELPSGWKVGEPASNQVEATGYFFKNLSYSWQDGMGLAPVIVCQSFSVREARATTPEVDQTVASMGAIVASAVAIAAAVIVLVLWRTGAVERKVGHDLEAARVGDALHKLAWEGD